MSCRIRRGRSRSSLAPVIGMAAKAANEPSWAPFLLTALGSPFQWLFIIRRKAGEELLRARFPAIVERFGSGGLAAGSKRGRHRFAQILMERANRPCAAMHPLVVDAEDIERSRHRKSSDRHPARKRLDIDQSERIGAAWQDEDVRRGISGGKLGAVLGSKKEDARIVRFQPLKCRSAADDDFAPGHIEREERLDILFDCNPTDVQKHRPRQALKGRMRRHRWIELRKINTAWPMMCSRKAMGVKLLGKCRRRRESPLGHAMEATHHLPHPFRWNAGSDGDIVREACVERGRKVALVFQAPIARCPADRTLRGDVYSIGPKLIEHR